MASRSEDSKAERGRGPIEAPAADGATRRRPTADAVERALAEVSRTLERLKQVRAERAEAETRFRAELQARDREIVELRAASAEMERIRQEAAAAVTARDEAQLRSEELAARVASLETAAGDRDQLVRELETARTDARAAAALAADLETQLAAARTADTDRAELQSALHATQQELQSARQELEAARAEAAGRAELESALQSAREELDAARAQSGEIQTREAEAAQRAASLQDRLEQLEQLEREAADAAAAAERERQRADKAEADARDATSDAADHVRVLESTLAQQREEAGAARAEAEAARAELEAALRRVRDLEAGAAEGASRDEELNRLVAEREDLAAALQNERAQLTAVQGLLEKERAAAAEAKQASEQERELAGELHQKLDLAADRIAELEQDLLRRDELLASQDAGEAQEALRAEIQSLRERLADAERARHEALAAPTEAAPAEARPAGLDDARLALRRQRLARARALVHERAQKAAKAEEILAQRLTVCEEVLSRRRELVQAREVIERAHKRVLTTKARSGAAAVLFFGLGIMAVLAGLSWAVVSRSFPATYAASGVVAAQFTEGEPTPKDLAEWQDFHESLLLDPQLMARASERFAQRGFSELSHPAALKTRLEQDMTWSEPEPGRLLFELRGRGREATVRALETYLTTLIAESGALRQRRTENSTTVLAEPVRPGTEPIEDERLGYAGIGLAGGSAFCLLLWLGIWKRMVRSKSAFENSTAVDQLLEDARWVDPIQKIIDAGESGSRAA